MVQSSSSNRSPPLKVKDLIAILKTFPAEAEVVEDRAGELRRLHSDDITVQGLLLPTDLQLEDGEELDDSYAVVTLGAWG